VSPDDGAHFIVARQELNALAYVKPGDVLREHT
jgi:hypothetical protein